MISCSLPYASVQSTATGNFLADSNKTIADLNALLACINELAAAAAASASGITGSGTTHFLPVWTGATTLGNSRFEDHGSSTNVDLQTNIGAGINGIGGLDGLNVFGAGASGFTGYTNLPPASVASVGWLALFTYNGSTGNGPPFISTYFAGGTRGSESAVTSTTVVANRTVYGWNGSGFVEALAENVTISVNWDGTHQGADYDLIVWDNRAGPLSPSPRIYAHGDGTGGIRPPSGGSNNGFAIAATVAGVDAQGGVTLEATNNVHIHSFLLLDNVAVAALPATPALGNVAVVNNALAPAVGSAVVGGGTAKALVWWNGAQWTVMGI